MPVSLVLASRLLGCASPAGGAGDPAGTEPAPCTDDDGTVHTARETWDAGDGCNTCSCEADGSWSCTDLGCTILVDECGWSSREVSEDARLVDDVAWLDAWDFQAAGLTVMTTDEGLVEWWAHTGYVEAGEVDFSTEIAVGFIGDWSPGCGEGERLAGIAAGDTTGTWYAGVASNPPCQDSCDDHLPRATLYAVPAGAVDECRFDWTCDG